MTNCPRCGKQLDFIQKYGLWFCSTCQQYFQPAQIAQPTQQPRQAQPPPYYYQPTPPPQYIPPSDKSILPIIIVVVVVVVILAFAAAFFMIQITNMGNLGSTGTTPVVSMNWNEDPEEPGNYMGNVVSISGTSSINTDDVTITVTHGGESSSRDLDILAEGISLQVGDLILDFIDIAPLGRLGAEDIFTITGGVYGDNVRLVYQPTGGMMCSITLS